MKFEIPMWFKKHPDFWISVACILAALLLRLPFRSQYLFHWDSINYALSLETYDVRLHQPHPPGYFLYSMLGKLVNLFVADANASLVWISVFGGTVGVAALYLLGKALYDRRTALLAAGLALTSPLYWFYSEVALSYALEFLLVTLIAWLCYLQLTGNKKVCLWLALLLGIAGGVRQNDLVFLLPLWLVSLLPLAWKQRVASLVTLGLVCTAWAAPMMALSGGVGSYLTALGSESSGIAEESSIFAIKELALNVGRMAIYLGYGLILAALPLAWGLIPLFREARSLLRDRRAWLMALWITPAALFYLLIHIRQPGHIFTFLPAILLLSARATIRLADLLSGLRRMAAATQALPMILTQSMTLTLSVWILFANYAFFLWAPASLFGSQQLPLQTTSANAIMQRDRFLEERFEAIRAHFNPASTVILAGGLNYHHPDYYLRDFQETSISYQLSDQPQLLPTQVYTLVLFDDSPATQISSSVEFQSLSLPSSGEIRYITWDVGQQAQISETLFEIVEK